MVKSGFAPLGLGRSVSRRFQWALECPRTISRPRACARPRWRRDNLKVITTGESDIQRCVRDAILPTNMVSAEQ